jgi:hypothetical protein
VENLKSQRFGSAEKYTKFCEELTAYFHFRSCSVGINDERDLGSILFRWAQMA